MYRALGAFAFLLITTVLPAQQPLPAASAAAATPIAPEALAGLETPWSIAPVIQEIGAHFGRLIEALNRIDTKAWVAKGASETYGQQLESCKAQAKAVADSAAVLARNPEQLAAGLELFFRFQAVETMLGSIEEGMRKYQSPRDADALASLEAEEGANRDRFQRYIVALAADRERQLKITDEEAQRCRAMFTTAIPPAAKSGKKK
jgi:hypothetical protein